MFLKLKPVILFKFGAQLQKFGFPFKFLGSLK